jgi:hypothetical protein
MYIYTDLLTSSTAALNLDSKLMLFSWNTCWQRSCPCNSSTCRFSVRFSSCNQQKQVHMHCHLTNNSKARLSMSCIK